jgi:hypothetical protein
MYLNPKISFIKLWKKQINDILVDLMVIDILDFAQYVVENHQETAH